MKKIDEQIRVLATIRTDLLTKLAAIRHVGTELYSEYNNHTLDEQCDTIVREISSAVSYLNSIIGRLNEHKNAADHPEQKA